MMDCLFGYIGLSSRVEATAESGLYVDALPDISLNLIEATPEKEGCEFDFWEKVEKRTILKFRTLFIAEVNRCHRLTDVSVCECLICENKELLAPALWYLMGAELLSENLGSPRLNRFTTLNRDRTHESRAELMDVFVHELATAVAGIDVHNSTCIQGDVEEVNLVVTRLPVM